MVKTAGPDLKRYMDKRLSLKLNGNRKVSGVLRGFDQFMNVTLDETVEEVSATESNRIGMVVRHIGDDFPVASCRMGLPPACAFRCVYQTSY
ncbi:hypothetical protein BBJ28_00014160 [Nothophytophthora sp. Chile5]|nr:hypothetical protein BBJ28_00014160 [Nothophytophthora sp. Chile5]